ncbi:MAG: hypothetical protein AABX96_00525, partial [Nanoarchaeota archaeon]
MRRLISILLFSFVFVTFLSLDVEAQTCPDNDRIMRISAPTNAHGENWSFGTATYTQDICYKTIFGQDYTGTRAGTNAVHDCITVGSNRVLRLKFNNNSHAEIPDHTTPAYGVDICYGDLTCQSVAGNLDCPDTTQEVISLSGATNAHIENYSMNVYNSNANYKKICCSTASPQIYNQTWRYYDGTVIPDASPPTIICPNSYKIMSVQLRGLTNGVSPVEFQLYDGDNGADDRIGSPIVVTASNDQANATLNLTDSALLSELQTALGGEPVGGRDYLELYFKANSSVYLNDSYIVRYTNDSNACVYSNPISSVLAPVHRGVYFNNTLISFVSGCTSQIGSLRHEWTVTQNGETYTSNERNFDLTFGGVGTGHFGDAGQVNVKLKCTDLRGKYAINESQILIVASPYTLAYIEKPAFESFVTNTPPVASRVPYFAERVDFSAADSFAVNVIPVSGSSCPTVSCLGGDCPAATQNVPTGCTASGNTISITGTSTPPLYANLFFNWTFWDDNWNEPWAMFEGL